MGKKKSRKGIKKRRSRKGKAKGKGKPKSKMKGRKGKKRHGKGKGKKKKKKSVMNLADLKTVAKMRAEQLKALHSLPMMDRGWQKFCEKKKGKVQKSACQHQRKVTLHNRKVFH